ncbi:glycosyltransferase family 39 protein [Planctomycetota bacterium]
MLLVWALGAAYLVLQLDQDWIPLDEGILAHSAERVMDGELPHRDFNEPYTGGLTFLHAFGFRVFGVNLLSLRLVLLFFALAFIPSVYRIAAHVAPPPVCGAATLLCLVFSVPNYVAGQPAWYNTFFAVFGLLCLLRHMDTDRWVWLFAAGLCGGLSFLAKSHGLYYIAAALLGLLFREQQRARALERGRGAGMLSLGLTALLLLFGFLLCALISHRPGPMELFLFAFPGLLLVAVLVRNEWQLRDRGGTARLRRLVRSVGTFVLGALLPVALFLVPFLNSSSVSDFYAGVFLAPQARLGHPLNAVPPVSSLWAAVPVALLVVAPLWLKGTRVRMALAIPALVACVAVACLGYQQAVYRAFWYSLRPAVPILSVIGCAWLTVHSGRGEGTGQRQEQLFLLLAVAALTSLVQFPVGFGVYFCYAAPMVILAGVYWASVHDARPGVLCAGAFVFYLLFAVLWLNRGSTLQLGFNYTPGCNDTRLELERGGLRVREAQARLYEWLIGEVQRHSDTAAYIFALPDSAEVYFLSGRRNPTRTLHDFLDPDFDSDPAGRALRILAVLESHEVNVVVLRRRAEQTPLASTGLAPVLRALYPNRAPSPSPLFEVRWRQ